jgi:hypothetical protein
MLKVNAPLSPRILKIYEPCCVRILKIIASCCERNKNYAVFRFNGENNGRQRYVFFCARNLKTIAFCSARILKINASSCIRVLKIIAPCCVRILKVIEKMRGKHRDAPFSVRPWTICVRRDAVSCGINTIGGTKGRPILRASLKNVRAQGSSFLRD